MSWPHSIFSFALVLTDRAGVRGNEWPDRLARTADVSSGLQFWEKAVIVLDGCGNFLTMDRPGSLASTADISSEARCPARRMLVNAREWRNKASEVALPTLLLVAKARSNARWRGRSLAFKTRWRMCFSGFRTSRSPSFVFMQTFSLFLLLADKTRTAVKVIYLLISVQFIFFHALWIAIFLSFYFSQQ